MKRLSGLLALLTVMYLSGNVTANGQDEPKPKKDTVNMDTNAKPQVYYDVEDDKDNKVAGKSSVPTIAIIIGAVVVIAGAAVVLLRKKKQ